MRTDGRTDMNTGRYYEVNKRFKHFFIASKNSFKFKLYLTLLHKYMDKGVYAYMYICEYIALYLYMCVRIWCLCIMYVRRYMCVYVHTYIYTYIHKYNSSVSLPPHVCRLSRFLLDRSAAA